MGPFQILFIVITVGFPAWLWTRTSTEKSKTDWIAFDRNLSRIVESDEGFPGCSTMDIIDIFHELCKDSYQKSGEGQRAPPVERASSDLVFSCHYTKGNIEVAWRLEEGHKSEMNCHDPGGDVVSHGPGFNFTVGGKIKSIEFYNTDNERERIPYRNCRLKAGKIKAISERAPAALSDFLFALGKDAKDPQDYYHGNMMCFTFDSSPLWKPWREKYFR
jgi:hypothetical protein